MILFEDVKSISFTYWLLVAYVPTREVLYDEVWETVDYPIKRDFYKMHMMGGEPYYFNRGDYE
jgi:hypothetical protein